MKGIVFTEFLDMVEQSYGARMVDDILNESDLESGGAYTSVGTYDHRELLEIVSALSEKTGTPVQTLVQGYGKHLFGRFSRLMPQFFKDQKSSFDFFETVDNHIHVEVRKIYPDAALPEFDTVRDGNTMEMTYRSRCPFADFADGLIRGCIEHFGETVEINSEDKNKEGTFSRVFRMVRK
ncbi:MAG: heme NO-binding domain-containing protein [Alphaproteobacteria bacterium]